MRRYDLPVMVLVIYLAFSAIPQGVQANPVVSAPERSTAPELIDAVNALREKQGLPPYQVNDILMGLAQAHAEYMASVHMSNIHTDAQGRRPFQRALDAGYPVAGDLSLGGWYSENVTGGSGMTAEQAVQQWMGDAPHQGTMLSTVLRDIGAGVAVSGNTYYYCLDAALSTGGTPVAYTPPPPILSPTPTIVVNTPNADGSIIHVIQSGDTVLAIAIAYGVPVNDIYRLNNITSDTTIYAGHKLTIRAANTPTPTQPTSTATPFPTATLWPTSAATGTELPSATAAPASPGMTSSKAGGMVLVIFLAALIIAGVITIIGSRRPK
jgi:uncharacterized protein YkwD